MEIGISLITPSAFKPLWWLSNPHLQTLWPVMFGANKPQGDNERLELDDGDFLDLRWFANDGPLVVVVHGLEGSIDSHYAGAMMLALQEHGFHGLFMHLRGCSGEPNRLDRSYHSGETGDLAAVVQHAARVTGKPVFAMIGYSLGANALLKWLGEVDGQAPLQRAVAVSVPFRLGDAARKLSTGFSRLYQSHLLERLRRNFSRKFRQRTSPVQVDVDRLRDFYSFDDKVTAPLHGFDSADDYYRQSSSRQYLKNIRCETLILHAQDDPFMYEESIPRNAELSPQVTLELSTHGGHVGFICGMWLPRRWLEPRIIRFLQS
ncbi:MAG: hydrolase [Pseudomonadota bacterium]|nr:hydrolase [Pseudomonadota bacterium]